MEKIASFTINHLNLFPGLYVSRRDQKENLVITTFDMRITAPNREPVIDMPALHTIEHLGATFLRNSEEKDNIVYFGPMGCRTGFYLILKGDLKSSDIVDLVKETFEFIADYDGEVPGASARDCGNYLDMNLPMAKYEAKLFLENTLNQITEANLVYPA